MKIQNRAKSQGLGIVLLIDYNSRISNETKKATHKNTQRKKSSNNNKKKNK